MTDALQNTPVTAVKSVGASLAKTLSKLGLTSVQDVLFHLPIRYMDRTRVVPISQLQPHTSVVIQGDVIDSQIVMGRRRSMIVTLNDGSGTTRLRFFHFNAAQKTKFTKGNTIRCCGEPRLAASGLEFYHPEYEQVNKFSTHTGNTLEETLTPIYGLTEGITQQRLRKVCGAALGMMSTTPLVELLPEDINARFHVRSLAEALHYVHFPPSDAQINELSEGRHSYQQRLAFEELLAHFLARQQLRLQAQQEHAPIFNITQAKPLIDNFLTQLPFAPTNAQARVLHEISKDMSTDNPMLRMLQGDVGSGKTLVAALASLQAVANGYQVAVVAPTEILAEQHFKSFTTWLEPLGIQTTWLVGKLSAGKKRDSLEAISDGTAQVVVGTHALFQEKVSFAKLGLSIIDEQHRFGVHQRLALRQKSRAPETPHQLVMTATPIPRTLAMTAYAELDYSVIDELPPGRTPVNTVVLSQGKKEQIIERIAVNCAQGKQVYWVCPLVEESETLSVANAEETYQLLTDMLPNINIGLVHGRLKAKEKETVMAEFKSGGTHLLVATTVIEVGVDVPNASLMIIENPERLGLAQLHQLRGRVGRGKEASHCILLYGDKLSEQARERLTILRETNDGFAIAEKDLALRGAGELLGTRQTGDMLYRLADAQRDAHLIPDVHQLGRELMANSPQHVHALINRWFGQRQAYLNA